MASGFDPRKRATLEPIEALGGAIVFTAGLARGRKSNVQAGSRMFQGIGKNELRLLADESLSVRWKIMSIIKGLQAIRHGFERAGEVAPCLQAGAVGSQEILRAEFIPLDYVNHLVKGERRGKDYLQRLLSDNANVVVRHFDGWCRDQGVRRNSGEENEELGVRLLAFLQQGKGDARKYGAVFVDEAQDFASSWFRCVLEAMADPLDGDLIIVGDGNQALYRNRDFTWSDVGVQAVGRTTNSKFDLDKCYRSTREIIALAHHFASGGQDRAEVAIAAMPIDPKLRNG